MIDVNNFLILIKEIVVLPIIIITFFLLMYISVYLWKKDPDIIRAKIFLNFNEFKKAFLLLAVFAFVLIFHVTLIYIPHLFYSILQCPATTGYDLQRFFGLVLALVMITFVYFSYRSIK